jgi:arylsulfatase A-like enzyme
MYDIITRVPLLIWAPGQFAGGRRLDPLCQWMDIGPTVLELAGITPPASFEAESLLPGLRSTDAEPWAGRDYVFAEHGRDGILQETEFMTMVRNHEWKLVHFMDAEPAPPAPYGQLFDLTADPGETNNLWADPAHADKRQELLDVLREWRIRSHNRSRNWAAAWR